MARDLAEVVDFGRYEPLFRIGLGGMAEVYAARIRGEAGFQKLVAVKRMLPHLTGDKKFVDMFLDEARLAANISSPHVVQTLDLGRAEDDSLYIVMDLIIGVTISQMLRHLASQKQFIDPGVAIELIRQAAQGLDDAHEAVAPNGQPLSLVHRDISPQNILIGTDGRARVTDFGIAHAIMLRRTETQVGEMKGKFAYFSPEQALGKSFDRRSDIFALGTVAWELVTGRRLFRGTPLEQLEAVKRAEVPTAISMRPSLSQSLSDAIMVALSHDPEDRYASAAAFASALRRSGASLDEIPGPRAIGHFVREVGGERLERMRQCIANSGKLPADVPKVTAIIEGTVSGTLFIADGADETHILDEVSQVVESSTATAPSSETPKENLRETAKRGLPPTEQVLMAFGSQVTTNKLPEEEGAAAAPLIVPPTRVKPIAEQPTLLGPNEASLTVPSPPDHAAIHQANTHQWMEASAQPATDPGPRQTSSRAMIAGLVAGLALIVVLGIVAIQVGGDEDDPSMVVSTPPTSASVDPEPESETEREITEAAAEEGATEDLATAPGEEDVVVDAGAATASAEEDVQAAPVVRRGMRRGARNMRRTMSPTMMAPAEAVTETPMTTMMSSGIPTWMRD